MSDERYPAELKITKQDFADCGWEEVLAKTTQEGYPSLWQAFSAAARQAIEDGRQAHCKVLWLLADACSMTLEPQSANAPFKPIFAMEGRRSAIPEDFSVSDIAFFADILEDIDDAWVRARIADLVWLTQSPREVKFALEAIDSYCCIPLEEKIWVRGGGECWARAISLARMLKDGAGDRIKRIEAEVVTVFCAAETGDGFLAFWLADLLYVNGLGRDQASSIANKLELLAHEFESEGDLHRAREYFDAAAKWYKRVGEDSKAVAMTVAVAECWVKEAVARESADNPSYMVAASFYENAIQVYRTIPRRERAAYRVEERIEELHKFLAESGERSLEEMGIIEAPGIDISELINNAQKAVRGKKAIDALMAFANLHRGIDVKKARQSAIERIRQHPLQAMLPVTVMSRDGRVIARRPGMSVGETLSEDDEKVIYAEMIRDYGILISVVVQGDIWPALEVLALEHRLAELDFVQIARQSPIVPIGREQLFGKALFSGYDRDFVAALHLLTPQIEHMVRYHLKQVRVKTTTLSIDGIENEIGLSALMELPEVQKIFGENIAFEIKALFCDPFGPNLRNELAHGLVDDETCYSPYSIYAWWFTLKLVFNTFWNAARGEKKRVEEGEN